ncbi:MAG: putative hydrolase or acyltransferase of alpha/beta superfamily [Novosphingobium lindaniclasticum]|jgi:pimeloyl-ACP methyl ester carboxylesterase|uniref:alpha/beta fold hydrolase n=1 Tax=Novosphingobium lindaniclasticum TaxID=1329895 RepID=UPI002409E668|nr:alpha/beta fold hydrolase [Novosphingobium lindaniclasticum]MDF2640556.1 putative hydrolase or acyltransferase of alpha/beta superfamily [Novosphingobium lindaniclasticum]
MASLARPPLLLLPGMACDEASWAPQIEALSDIATCTVADHGLHRSMTAMAQAALKQAPPRFSLAGHSMGGRVALEMVRLAPQRVERLCLIGTEHLPRPSGEAGERETAGRRSLLTIARTDGMAAMACRWLPSLIASDRVGDMALTNAIVAMVARHGPDQLEAQIAAGHDRPDHRSLLPAIACRTLLIAGGADVMRPAAILADMADMIAGSSLCVIPGSGHMPMMEQPDIVSAAMRDWLRAEGESLPA